ncbi:BREX system serine/threonine kinase PglW [Cellulomonas endophytica]|uniref:BREX system serine/threonine kinase PglW n=1 Tax=Cellulomonas endophytica TaxID=2494735 RepID=UPI001012972C|nr:BREX system serine/threonine kinase PglW [Cellulomonas endophytica]
MSQWFSLAESQEPHERRALNKLREIITEDPHAWGWSNLSFLDRQGRTHELDAVVVTRAGVFVVELKHFAGRITGTQQNWRVTSPRGTTRSEKNPFWLTELKGKRLKSLLQENSKVDRRLVPFVDALVVLHGEPSVVALPDDAAHHVVALDGFDVTWKDHGLRAFLRRTADNKQQRDQHLDPHHMRAVAAMIKDAGFVPTPKTRTVGQYVLDKVDPLGSGPTWQDLLAQHPMVAGEKVRIRLFDVPPGASEQQRREISDAARREYHLTSTMLHPGIVRPRDIVQTESGAALLFQHDPAELPLDEWLTTHAEQLDLDARLAVVREVGETLAWAHQQRLTHRALTPAQVTVRGEPGRGAQVGIRDWMTGAREAGTTTTTQTYLSAGVDDVVGLVDQARYVYLAPEQWHRGEEADVPPIPLDVYGFGAVAHLVLTGRPPAATMAEVMRLRESGAMGLDPAVAAPTLPESFASAVLHATAFDEELRTATVADVLAELEKAYEDATAPSPTSRPSIDPADATKGDVLHVDGQERFEVVRRRGTGGTGVALEVVDYVRGQEGLVLKVARDERAEARLRAEAELLARVGSRRRHVVELLDGPLEVNGRIALLMSDAGDQTLAAWLAAEGRLSLEYLERWGTQLLDAVAHLDGLGVFHRDVKPANLAIAPDPGSRRQSLTLFDLSLAAEPLTDKGSGTRDYMDPFLADRSQFDGAAERWSVAVTLFQMATNVLPWWTKGNDHPLDAKDTLAFAEATFVDELVAPRLDAFFRHALASRPADRPGSTGALAEAWRAVFADLDVQEDEDQLATLAAEAAAASLDTPLDRAGLTARALSGLRSLRAGTVRDLLARPTMEINQLKGLGERYRKEIQARVREWRSLLTDPETTLDGDGGGTQFGTGSVEHLVGRFLKTAKGAGDTPVARLLLGADDHDDVLWPTLPEVAALTGTERADVTAELAVRVQGWRRTKVQRELRDQLLASIDALEGVATLDEVVDAVLREHGSTLRDAPRRRRAAGLVRALVELESFDDAPRVVHRRSRTDGSGSSVLLAAAGEDDRSEELLTLAAGLGTKADVLASQGAPLPDARGRTELDAVAGSDALSPARRLSLAAAASATAALSAYAEITPRDLDWRLAVAAVLSGQGLRTIEVAGIRRRVRGRFPWLPEDAVPSGAELSQAVQQVAPALVRHGDTFELSETSHPSTASSTLTSITATRTSTVPQVLAVLQRSVETRSGLLLAVTPERHEHASQQLAAAVPGLVVLDVADALVREARRVADEDGADWSFVLGADAEPDGSPLRSQLHEFLEAAVDAVWEQVVSTDAPLLLVHAGPLLRHGFEDRLDHLLDLATARRAARWVLAPRPSSSGVPLLDGHPVPVGAGRWTDLPADPLPTLTGAPS